MSLSAFLTWFYCLDYHELYLLVILGTAVYLCIMPRFLSWQRYCQISIGLAFCSLGLIVGMTLFTRNSVSVSPALLPFHSYLEAVTTGNVEIYRSNLMNALLFYPFGLFLGAAMQSDRKKLVLALLFAAVLSLEIEVCQFCFQLGNPEVDDVLHNTLGACMGLMLPRFLKTLSGRYFYGAKD